MMNTVAVAPDPRELGKSLVVGPRMESATLPLFRVSAALFVISNWYWTRPGADDSGEHFLTIVKPEVASAADGPVEGGIARRARASRAARKADTPSSRLTVNRLLFASGPARLRPL